ncbi:MAG: hypothetical protein HYR62_07075 [Actinobacteria bacterium]|nr:hypothetical protein [Actinomycetota bacterium]MBI3685940.1 hypothetical protein [Actinomycetota bacterium]
MLIRTGDTEGARQWLQIAANDGHIRAMTMLGLYHAESGNGRSAAGWLTRAAEAGDDSAMNFLGAVYDEQGDVVNAVQWWGQAAQRGNAQGMFNLGELLVRTGYQQDGEGWIRAAAQAGNPRAVEWVTREAARRSVPSPRPAPPPVRRGDRAEQGGYQAGYQDSRRSDGPEYSSAPYRDARSEPDHSSYPGGGSRRHGGPSWQDELPDPREGYGSGPWNTGGYGSGPWNARGDDRYGAPAATGQAGAGSGSW